MWVLRFSRLVALGCAIASHGCGENKISESKCDFEPAADAGAGICNSVTAQQADEGAGHVEDCSKVAYDSNPPSSGAHYGTWAAFGIYSKPLPRGFYVHSMEHGAVVFSYKPGCTDEIDQAEDLIAELVDADCGSPRVILTPDPLLDTRWAASAWGYTLRASCFDAAEMKRFFDEHVGKAPENVCTPHPGFMTTDVVDSLPNDCGR